MKKLLALLLALLMVMNTGVVFAKSNGGYETIIEPKFDDAQVFSDGFAAVCKDGKWGYIDETGAYLAEPQYDYAARFSEGKAVVASLVEEVKQEGTEWEYTYEYWKAGFIDEQGNYTPLISQSYLERPFLSYWGSEKNTDTTVCCAEIEYDSLFEIDRNTGDKIGFKDVGYIDGYLSITYPDSEDSKCWIFDSNGKRIDSYINDSYGTYGESKIMWGIYSDGMIESSEGGATDTILYYDINKNFQFSKPYYTGNYYSTEEEAEAGKREQENNGIDYYFESIYPFNDGYAGAWVLKNEPKIEKYTGYFNDEEYTQYEVSVRNYDDNGECDNAYFALIDKAGNIVFTGDYTAVKYTDSKRLTVLNNNRIVLKNTSGKFGAVDKNGNIIIPFEYDDMSPFIDTVTAAKKDGIWYQIDIDGNMVSKTDYDYLAGREPESKASIAVKNNKVFVVIDDEKVSGSELIADDKYDTGSGGMCPEDKIIIKENGKYGYAALDTKTPRTTVTSVGVKISWYNPKGIACRVFRYEQGGTPEAISDVIYGNSFVDVNVESNKKYYYMIVPESDGVPSIDESISAEAVTETILELEGTGNKNFILMKLGKPTMLVGEEVLEIDPGRGTTPVVQNGRTLVPIRAIVEAMGGRVDWSDAEQKITLNACGHNIQMTLGQKEFTADGKKKSMDIAPDTINDRTMLPIRFVAENAGCQVEWIGSTQDIIIVFNGEE